MATKTTTKSNSKIHTNTTPTKSPFCTFCFNLGKSPEIYTSHYIRETPAPDSRIVCPELKACKCMGCGKSGHTISKCRAAAPYKNRYDQQKTPKPTEIKPKNIYSLLLAEDENTHSDDEETATVATVASIASSTTTQNEVSMKSYAAALMSVLQPTRDTTQSTTLEPTEPTKPTYDFSVFRTTKRYASWADMESSDDEE